LGWEGWLGGIWLWPLGNLHTWENGCMGLKKNYMDVFGQHTIGKNFSSSACNQNKLYIYIYVPLKLICTFLWKKPHITLYKPLRVDEHFWNSTTNVKGYSSITQ